ncbi:hypothetical protein NL676_020781 [Syzygium grande]|nr:hypothetical protein NL676_020781 [Syzygium grande]
MRNFICIPFLPSFFDALPASPGRQSSSLSCIAACHGPAILVRMLAGTRLTAVLPAAAPPAYKPACRLPPGRPPRPLAPLADSTPAQDPPACRATRRLSYTAPARPRPPPRPPHPGQPPRPPPCPARPPRPGLISPLTGRPPTSVVTIAAAALAAHACARTATVHSTGFCCP